VQGNGAAIEVKGWAVSYSVGGFELVNGFHMDN